MKFFTSVIPLCILILLVGIIATIGIQLQKNGSYLGLDFRSYYAAAVILRNGAGNNLYNLNTQYYWQHKLIPQLQHPQLLPFLNPPFMALFMQPLALVPMKNAYLVWICLNSFFLMIYFWVFSLLFIKSRSSSYKHTYVFLLLTIAYPPLWVGIIHGQPECILLFGILLFLYMGQKKKRVLAGVCLSLLTIRINLIILPFFLLLWKKEWKVLSGLLIGMGIVFIFSLFTVGKEQMQNYFLFLLHTATWENKYGIHVRMEPTLRGFLYSLTPKHYHSVLFFPWIAGILVTVYLFLKSWKGNMVCTEEKFLLFWSYVIMIMLFSSVHSNYYDLTLLLIPEFFLLHAVIKKIPVKYLNKIHPYSPLIFFTYLLGRILFLTFVYRYPQLVALLFVCLIIGTPKFFQKGLLST